MKKIFACALCVVMTVSLCSCVGCRKKEETKAKEKETIELWHYWDIPDNQRHLEELVEQFNKMQEDIEIEVSYIPDEDFKKQLALGDVGRKDAGYCRSGLLGLSISTSYESVC